MKKVLMISLLSVLLISVPFLSKAQDYSNTGNIYTLNGYTGYYGFAFTRTQSGQLYYFYYNITTNTYVGVASKDLSKTITSIQAAPTGAPIDSKLALLAIGMAGILYHVKFIKKTQKGLA